VQSAQGEHANGAVASNRGKNRSGLWFKMNVPIPIRKSHLAVSDMGCRYTGCNSIVGTYIKDLVQFIPDVECIRVFRYTFLK